MYGGGPEIARDLYFPVYSIAFRRQEIKPSGINNPLNLCYMISIMQGLLSIPQLNYYILKRLYSQQQDTKKKPFHSSFTRFLKQFIDDQHRIQDIKQFASIFQNKFNPYEQHDAQEFFLHLADSLQEQMKLDFKTPQSFKNSEAAYHFYMETNRSIIDKVFAGQITSTVICEKCREQSHSYLPFIDICLEITQSTLQGCLKRHFQFQRLDDLYECQKCKKKSKARKKLTLTKSPNYLMIVLKKFTSSGKKIQDRIKYPSQIDLKKFADGYCGETKFLLQSVIVHKGARSSKGHYICYTRRTKNEWFYCNDDTVKRLGVGDCLSREAYILIYERSR